MPIYMCSSCGSIDNTATGGYWRQQHEAYLANEKHKPLCSACDPSIGKWHGRFPRRPAEGYVTSKDGFIYSKDESENYFKHLGPFKPVVLPVGGETN